MLVTDNIIVTITRLLQPYTAVLRKIGKGQTWSVNQVGVLTSCSCILPNRFNTSYKCCHLQFITVKRCSSPKLKYNSFQVAKLVVCFLCGCTFLYSSVFLLHLAPGRNCQASQGLLVLLNDSLIDIAGCNW